MVLTAIFVGTFFTSIFVKKIARKNYPVYFGFATLLIFLIGSMFINDMLNFKRFYNIALILIPLVMIVYIIALVPEFKTNDNAKIFVGGFITMSFVPLWEFFANICNTQNLLSSSYPIVMAQAAVLILVIMDENIIKNNALIKECENREKYFIKSTRDELTGLYNREYWISIVEQLKIPFSVAMIDIDDFKNVNDKFGHQYGDLVLKSIADVMKITVREQDVLGRYGGDEFIVVFTCLEDEAKKAAERLRAKVEALELVNKFGNVNATITMGLYHVRMHMSVDEMINMADSAMYEAKKQGKNSVVIYKD